MDLQGIEKLDINSSYYSKELHFIEYKVDSIYRHCKILVTFYATRLYTP